VEGDLPALLLAIHRKSAARRDEYVTVEDTEVLGDTLEIH
jgi:hypothetical protein